MLELILTDIELKENVTNDNTFDIWHNDQTGTFIAKENNGNRTFKYKLDGDFETIAKNHRQEILEYCLAVVLPTETVSIGDIFVHGKYLEIIL
jgi:hypothetical protein